MASKKKTAKKKSTRKSVATKPKKTSKSKKSVTKLLVDAEARLRKNRQKTLKNEGWHSSSFDTQGEVDAFIEGLQSGANPELVDFEEFSPPTNGPPGEEQFEVFWFVEQSEEDLEQEEIEYDMSELTCHKHR